ncbi:hypothetical protein EDC01DRAFT_631656 [Geopyxis carbonaria]|nr:hypothetical protein EDC01DRAFT_631656 [Geopyxis carbonaria]
MSNKELCVSRDICVSGLMMATVHNGQSRYIEPFTYPHSSHPVTSRAATVTGWDRTGDGTDILGVPNGRRSKYSIIWRYIESHLSVQPATGLAGGLRVITLISAKRPTHMYLYLDTALASSPSTPTTHNTTYVHHVLFPQTSTNHAPSVPTLRLRPSPAPTVRHKPVPQAPTRGLENHDQVPPSHLSPPSIADRPVEKIQRQ